jgi:methionyl-tRNA synthetase
MKKGKHILVTAALPYANGPLHIGHIAGCYLPADIYSRYMRKQGHDVKFVCGSDEHGMAITMRAKKEGKQPQEIVDRYHKLMGESFEKFGISFDIYSRTSNQMHHETAQDFFTTLYAKGIFKEEETEQLYDEEANQFLADRYIKGTCPKCAYTEAYGDQCEKCGTTLSPSELISPKSTLTGNTPTKRKTKNWFLPLDTLSPIIKQYIEDKKSTWKPNVYGQCMSWINEGLQARAMTRDLDWGIKVPLADAEGKVLYVWFDAPIGYISATKELLPETWEDYWKGEDSSIVHFIGKDNIVFHCIIFPAMLHAHGGYNMPDQVPANEFLNLEGNKISTSRNWAVWLHEYLEEFPNREDELRYVLTSIAPETSDSEFTWKDFQSRVNNELVAVFGNFVNRVITLIHKYYNGTVPEVVLSSDPNEAEIKKEIDNAYFSVNSYTSNYRFRQGLSSIMELARFGNKYLTTMEPWKRATENPAEVKQTLVNCLSITAHLGNLLSSYLPKTSNQLQQLLQIPEYSYDYQFSAGHQINEPFLLFRKIEDEEIQFQIEKLAKINQLAKKDITQFEPEKQVISFDTFSSLDLRTGYILEAKKVEKTDKLLQLTVDIGYEKRTIVSGIAQHYSPESLIGKTVLVVVNLEPRTIRGVLSKGMILMAENNGKLSMLHPDNNLEGGGFIVK